MGICRTKENHMEFITDREEGKLDYLIEINMASATIADNISFF